MEEHLKGRVKLKAFCQMMTKTMSKKDACKIEKHIFRSYDTNNNGSIDFIEFMLIL